MKALHSPKKRARGPLKKGETVMIQGSFSKYLEVISRPWGIREGQKERTRRGRQRSSLKRHRGKLLTPMTPTNSFFKALGPTSKTVLRSNRVRRRGAARPSSKALKRNTFLHRLRPRPKKRFRGRRSRPLDPRLDA